MLDDEYMSTREAAQKWGITVQRVRTLCKENRIPGMQIVSHTYIIPVNAEKPTDARLKSAIK